jgi:hypothetical protein
MARKRASCVLCRAFLWPVELAVEVTAELCLGDTGVAEVGGDLAVYVGTRIVYWYLVVFFAIEVYLEKVGGIAASLALWSLLVAGRVVRRIVAAHTRTALLAGIGLAGSSFRFLASSGRQLQPGNLPLLEIRRRVHEDIALQALCRSMLVNKTVVRVVTDTDLVAELADFHPAVGIGASWRSIPVTSERWCKSRQHVMHGATGLNVLEQLAVAIFETLNG